MNRLFHPTLVRRVVLALLAGFPILWLVLVSVRYATLTQQWAQDRRDFASTALALRLRTAFASAEDAVEIRAIAAAVERLDNMQRQSVSTPFTVVMQIFDRHDQRMVYSTPVVADHPFHGRPNVQIIEVVHGLTFDVWTLDTPRWTILWARTRLEDKVWLVRALGGDLYSSMAIALPCLLVPVWLAASRGLRPLRRFSDRIASRGSEDLSPIGVDVRHLELKPLAVELDRLLAKLRRKVETERTFVASAAHELRTPLAVVAAQAHVLAKAPSERERLDAERQMEAAMGRASHLIHQLLTLTRLEMQSLQSGTVDVAQIVRQELGHFVQAASRRAAELSLEAPDRLFVTLDVEAFRSVFQNLIDNAIRYGKDGGRIVIDMQREGSALTLAVADNGPGIASSERARVFDRFYRGTGHETPGTGLGLTIVHEAVTRMGGDVCITDGLDGAGCRFLVRIPCAPSPSAS